MATQLSRRPLQGVTNIVRFNWHFYVLAAGVGVLLMSSTKWLPICWHGYVLGAAGLVVGSTLLSLLASAYVYDWSDLYALTFIADGGNPTKYETSPHVAGARKIVNINAGFDETSTLLRDCYSDAELVVLDFYDPSWHTKSIERARRAYPPYPGTLAVTTAALPLANASVDRLFLILAAHEIRDAAERVAFFRECYRVLAPGGRIYVTEHLRDAANFVVYNIGFLHFHSRRSWLTTFAAAGLAVLEERKSTPFISTFILAADAPTT